MSDRSEVCCRTWLAPRVDVPTSVNVNHVCDLPLGHPGPCCCVCGAFDG